MIWLFWFLLFWRQPAAPVTPTYVMPPQAGQPYQGGPGAVPSRVIYFPPCQVNVCAKEKAWPLAESGRRDAEVTRNTVAGEV